MVQRLLLTHLHWTADCHIGDTCASCALHPVTGAASGCLVHIGGTAGSVAKVTIKMSNEGAGFGMSVADSCHITECAQGSVAQLARVPVPSRIIEVDGVPVADKKQMLVALKAAGKPDGGITFVFLTNRSALAPAVAPGDSDSAIVGGNFGGLLATSAYEVEYMEEDV